MNLLKSALKMLMSDYKLFYTRIGFKEKNKAIEAGFSKKIEFLLETIKKNPYEIYPPYKKLLSNMVGAYSRRINHQHRLVYVVYEKEKIVKVISMWTHYDSVK